MRIVGIIPARMAASRFPGKPLARLCGRPMIEHVYRRATRARSLDHVCIATPDRAIYEACAAFGATAIMTSPAHARATDRVAEAACHLAADVVVNIQGDEALLHPDSLDALAAAMAADPALACANLVNTFQDDADFTNRNQIKVVCDLRDNVLFMSRQPIPDVRSRRTPCLRQLGIIAFRRDFLATFAALPATPLEEAESIDMLRALEHGFRIRAVMTPHESFGIDTPDDLAAAETRLDGDPITVELFGTPGARRA